MSELLPCPLAVSKLTVQDSSILLTEGEGQLIFDHVVYLRRLLQHTSNTPLGRAFELVYEALAKQPLPAGVTVVDVMERLKELVEYDDSELWKQPPRTVSVTGIVTLTAQVRTNPGQTLRQAVERAGLRLYDLDGTPIGVTIDDVQEL